MSSPTRTAPPAPPKDDPKDDDPKDGPKDAPKPDKKLSDEISIDQARAWLGFYRLVSLYRNRSTRHQFRDAAEAAGYDVGKPDDRGRYEVGELEAALQELPPEGRA